ncbi:hypothetical protein GCM10017556_15980 [Micromonospora sagamiensis]|nr:hypothetical protein GCM10017556_15980 [Micromonospora sagamiensis]
MVGGYWLRIGLDAGNHSWDEMLAAVGPVTSSTVQRTALVATVEHVTVEQPFLSRALAASNPPAAGPILELLPPGGGPLLRTGEQRTPLATVHPDGRVELRGRRGGPCTCWTRGASATTKPAPEKKSKAGRSGWTGEPPWRASGK